MFIVIPLGRQYSDCLITCFSLSITVLKLNFNEWAQCQELVKTCQGNEVWT